MDCQNVGQTATDTVLSKTLYLAFKLLTYLLNYLLTYSMQQSL